MRIIRNVLRTTLSMTGTAYILCAAIVAGLSWLATDLVASTYHWNISSVPMEKGALATSLGVSLNEPIVIVVHPSNPVDNLSIRQLARIYSGEVTEWTSGELITAINRPIESDVRRRFYHFVLNTTPTQKFSRLGRRSHSKPSGWIPRDRLLGLWEGTRGRSRIAMHVAQIRP